MTQAFSSIDRTLDRRFGPEYGEPQTFNGAGNHDLYTPQAGKRVRLRWLLMYSDPDNSGKCLVNIFWSVGAKPNIYRAPFPASTIGAFGHSSIRESEVDAVLR